MRIKRFAVLLSMMLMLLGIIVPLEARPAASNQAEVREVVQRVFEQLKAGQYGELYEMLPSGQQARISRERFTSALERTRNMYELDRMEIGALRVSGDLAVVDTVLYGRVLRPFESEGKIVVQQYLVREDGRWRVATGDRATVQRFLASNPRFERQFPIRSPRVYIKRDGRWMDVSQSLRAAARSQSR